MRGRMGRGVGCLRLAELAGAGAASELAGAWGLTGVLAPAESARCPRQAGPLPAGSLSH